MQLTTILTSCTILNYLFRNRHLACSTRKLILCGTGILPVLDNDARYQNSYYATTKTLLTNSRKPWRNRLQSSTTKKIATGYHARSVQRPQKTYAVYFR